MTSGSNEDLQQELEYTLQNLIVTSGEFQKCYLSAFFLFYSVVSWDSKVHSSAGSHFSFFYYL